MPNDRGEGEQRLSEPRGWVRRAQRHPDRIAYVHRDPIAALGESTARGSGVSKRDEQVEHGRPLIPRHTRVCEVLSGQQRKTARRLALSFDSRRERRQTEGFQQSVE